MSSSLPARDAPGRAGREGAFGGLINRRISYFGLNIIYVKTAP